MLTKGYIATNEDLDRHNTGQLVINRGNGLLGKRSGVGVGGQAPYAIVRPGLSGAMKFYAATLLDKGLLISISDNKQTRYYWMTPGVRETFIIDAASHSFEEAWENLFKGLLADDSRKTVSLYNRLSMMFYTYFKNEGVKQTFGIEGTWKKEHFIASVEWDPEQAGKVRVISTLDHLKFRDVPLAYHPIEATHRVCRK